MYKTGNLTEEQCRKTCSDFLAESVKVVIVDVDNDEVPCYGIDEYDCKYNFVYYYDGQNCLKVRAQKERECPPPVYVLGIVLGVIAAIVLIGLAFLLLWKLLTTIHDRREFARFEKERMNAKWDTVRIKLFSYFMYFKYCTYFMRVFFFSSRAKILFTSKQPLRSKIRLMPVNKIKINIVIMNS